MHIVCVNIFVAIVLKPRFKIDVVIMIICSIVIIINSVLTLQVSTAKPMIADLVEQTDTAETVYTDKQSYTVNISSNGQTIQ